MLSLIISMILFVIFYIMFRNRLNLNNTFIALFVFLILNFGLFFSKTPIITNKEYLSIITFIIFLALFAMLFIVHYSKRLITNVKSKAIALSFIFGLSLFFCTDYIACNNMVQTDTTEEVINTSTLVPFKNDSSSHDTFFLGYDSTKKDAYYYFHTKTEDGYELEKVKTENTSSPVHIKYISSNETPHIVQYSIVSKKTIIKNPNILVSFFSYLYYSDYEIGDVVTEQIHKPIYDIDNPDRFRYVIYIPEGSIHENYVFDKE